MTHKLHTHKKDTIEAIHLVFTVVTGCHLVGFDVRSVGFHPQGPSSFGTWMLTYSLPMVPWRLCVILGMLMYVGS